MELTKNFSLEEMLRSDTAKRCGITNKPKAEEETEVVENLKALCVEVLQPLRDFLGKPVVVSSGYRCRELNEKVGGVSNSQHLTGEAADIRVKDRHELIEIMRFIMDETVFDQLIREKSATGEWVHVSYKRNGNNRQQVFKLTR
ncbi:MAG: D-Ala-D-Ala carboxypeptidase family metallohydrolase [Prevotellaceae bacterium]|nr:D-Ala-D-Ala carboxypeptidase family metallohydrolase [Prevotellaceae bacterium]